MTEALRQAAAKLGAVPADIVGLWWAPGYPELTSAQLLAVAGQEQPSAISVTIK